MKASIDRDNCIGCALCESICPEVFEMDDEGLASVIVDEIPAESEDDALDAAESCPVSVITVE
ncbi:MAG TPA: ferredoxin [Clostridiales bacterium]|jgi:ferredoxin|nr:ferredoxin [Clostridiales bacterium]